MKLEKMKQLVSSGKMSRRDFVQLSMAAGLTAAAGENLFNATARATPKKGGSFQGRRLVTASTTDYHDPGHLGELAWWPSSANMHASNTWSRSTPRMAPAPGLAESWEASGRSIGPCGPST
jgi:peptide/nickel transport system substrate-binding protein